MIVGGLRSTASGQLQPLRHKSPTEIGYFVCLNLDQESKMSVRSKSRIGVFKFLFLLAWMSTMTIPASATQFDPAASDPRITAALDAQKRLQNAMQGDDIKSIEGLFAPDLIVNAPNNRVVDRENVLELYRRGFIKYEPNVVRNIDFAGVRGDTVVIMGEEIVHPIGNTSNAGKFVRRRFTDVWKNSDGGWQLAIRQVTVTSAE